MAAVKVDELKYIQLGVRGENDVLDFPIDISEWLAQWPDAFYGIIAVRHDESAPYIAVTEQSGDNLIWKVSATDTAIMGTGYMEVRAVGTDGQVKKTRVVPTVVDRSLDGVTADVPEPMADWVTQVMGAYAEMMESQEGIVADCVAQLRRAMEMFDNIALRVDEPTNGYVQLHGGTGVALADINYPVGSYFITAGEINPSALFGGTWEKVRGRMILAEDDDMDAGTIGGSSSMTLAIEHLPKGTMIEGEEESE